MTRARKDRPLACRVDRDVLTIEIGVDVLAHALLRSDYAYTLMGPAQHRPDTRYEVTDASGFAHDVVHELLDEAEDGSSLLTRVLDKACEQAVEQGSEHFEEKKKPPRGRR